MQFEPPLKLASHPQELQGSLELLNQKFGWRLRVRRRSDEVEQATWLNLKVGCHSKHISACSYRCQNIKGWNYAIHDIDEVYGPRHSYHQGRSEAHQSRP